MKRVAAGETGLDVVQAGAGRDLVLLHSLLTDRSAFDGVVPDLARNRRLTLVNLPGYGGSPPALARGIAGATFLEIPGCGHCPQIEDPRAFVDAVSGFLPS